MFPDSSGETEASWCIHTDTQMLRASAASEGALSAVHTGTSPCGKTGLCVADHVNCGLMAGWENAASSPFPWGQRTDADKVRQGRQEGGLTEEGAQDCIWRNSHWTRVTRSSCGLKPWRKPALSPGVGATWNTAGRRRQSLPPHPGTEYKHGSLTAWGTEEGKSIHLWNVTCKQPREEGWQFPYLQITGREMRSGSLPTPSGTNTHN